jgi:hypothetical protein
MKNSKAFELINGLNNKQIKALELAIKSHKRESLTKLFHCLAKVKGKEEPDSEAVYMACFGKKYTKANDYLLRNEYRLLFEWMLTQLSELSSSDIPVQTIKKLRFLLQNQMHQLFEEELKAEWKSAVQADNSALLLELSDLNIQYHFTGKSQSLTNAEESKQLSIQRLEILKINFLREVRKEEIRANVSQRIISAYKPEAQNLQHLTKVDLVALEANDLYAQYLSLRSKINFSKGEEKITLLKQVIADEAIIKKYEPQPEEALCRFWANIAQEYYLLMDFSNAMKYFQLLHPLLHQLPSSIQESVLLNYIMSLMRNENYEEARLLALDNAELLLKSKLLGARAPFLIGVLHLYARDAESANNYVNLEIKKEGSEFYFLTRLLLSAVYYLRNDLDLALRETINLDQAVNYEMNREQTAQTLITKPIITIFRRFYTILLNTTDRKYKLAFDELTNDINNALVSQNDQQPNSILTQWMRREIKFLTKSDKA